MQQLHLVGFTTDHDSLIFSGRKGAKSGGFVLPLDEALLATIADAVRRRLADGEDLEVPAEILTSAAPALRRQSQLSPREIQDRLRAGRSLEAIAAEAGVGEEWVARFAAPVEAERSQIVGRARELVYAKPRRGDSAEMLGLAVRWNLADRGVRLTNDEYDDGWSAYQVADHTWMVTFTFVSRKRTQEAEWEVDLATGELVSRNRLASDLGYVEPGRRRRSLASLQPVPLLGTKGARRPGAPTAARPADDEDDDDDRSARSAPRAAVKRRPLPTKRSAGRAVKAPAAKKAAVGKAPAKRASASKTSARKTVAAKRAAAKAPGTRTAAASKRTAAPRSGTPARGAKAAGTKSAARATATPRKAGAVGKRAAKAQRSATTRARAGGAQELPPAVVAAVIERPEPNELGQRRLQLATGAPRPANSGRRPAPAPPAATPPRPQPRPGAPVRIAATRSTDAGPRTTSGADRPPPAPSTRPSESSAPPGTRRPEGTPTTAPEDIRSASSSRRATPAPDASRPAGSTRVATPAPVLDVEDEATAEARRAERRRARAEARAAAGATGSPPPVVAPRRTGGSGRAPADVPPGDGRVVTIRANRASPPRTTGDETGDVVLPGDRPPLRAAQPATQPRRRRFSRSN